jgi:glycosyltransferase involved in cell wall biosynthesis
MSTFQQPGRNVMKKKIEIACLGYDLSGGGAENVALQLLKHLNRDCFSIHIGYLRSSGELHHLLPDDLSPNFFTRGADRFRKTILAGFRGFRSMARNADVLFGMMEGIPIYLAALIGALEAKPSVGWNHITTSKSFADISNLHRVLMPVFYPRVTQLVCVSDGAREDLMKICRFSNAQPVTIHNSLDVDTIRAKGNEPLPEFAKAWYNRPTVIGVGRLVPQKRIDRLIEAFTATIGAGINANLIVLGQGPLEDELRALTERLQITSKVFFAGFQSNPYPFMKSSSVLVMSSDYEGFGMVLLEAMALGVPVISTDCPSGPREILEDGKNGILTSLADTDGIARAISSILQNQEARRRYAANGRQRVRDFHPSRMVQEFEDLFVRLGEPKRNTSV